MTSAIESSEIGYKGIPFLFAAWDAPHPVREIGHHSRRPHTLSCLFIHIGLCWIQPRIGPLEKAPQFSSNSSKSYWRQPLFMPGSLS